LTFFVTFGIPHDYLCHDEYLVVSRRFILIADGKKSSNKTFCFLIKRFWMGWEAIFNEMKYYVLLKSNT